MGELQASQLTGDGVYVVGKDIKISKNDGISSYGQLVQLVESPKQPGLLYAGADDGSDDAGVDERGVAEVEHDGRGPVRCELRQRLFDMRPRGDVLFPDGPDDPHAVTDR